MWWRRRHGPTILPLPEKRFYVSVGVSPSVLTYSFTGVNTRTGGYTTKNTRLLRLSMVSKRFIPGVSFNTPIVTKLSGIYSLPFSIRLVVDRPLQCVSSCTSTNTSLVAFRLRDSSSPGTIVSGVLTQNYGPTVTVGPNAPTRTILPCTSQLTVILIVAIRPNFNNRDFVTSVVPGLALLHDHCPRLSLRISKNVGLRAMGTTTGTKTGIFITKSTIFGDTSPTTAVTNLYHTTRRTTRWNGVGGGRGQFCDGSGQNRG